MKNVPGGAAAGGKGLPGEAWRGSWALGSGGLKDPSWPNPQTLFKRREVWAAQPSRNPPVSPAQTSFCEQQGPLTWDKMRQQAGPQTGRAPQRVLPPGLPPSRQLWAALLRARGCVCLLERWNRVGGIPL